MPKENTIIILKPDALKKGAEYEILDRFRKKGLVVEAMCKTTATEEVLREHYAAVIADKGEEIGKQIIASMTSGPVIVAMLSGNNAIQSVRAMSGEKTEPVKCPPGTIRHDYANDSYAQADLEKRSVENIIHSSDSPASAEREINLWFNKYITGVSKNISDHIYKEIARKINYDAPALIKDIVLNSNNEQILYHGIKNRKTLPEVLRDGIKPLTPENGPCSFWATGLALFEPDLDSPFFNYAGQYSAEEPEVTELNIALTSIANLQANGITNIKYASDSQILINKTVPPQAFKLLNVRVYHPVEKDSAKLREYGQKAEQLMLLSLTTQMYSPKINGDTNQKNLWSIETVIEH